MRFFGPQGGHVAPMGVTGVKFGALVVKIWLDLLKGIWSYGGFKLRGSGSPKFSAPPSGETMRQTTKRF